MHAKARLLALADPATPRERGVLAVRQVVLATASPLMPEDAAFRQLVDWCDSPEASQVFDALHSASLALCPLEALAHLTDDTRRELESARQTFLTAARACTVSIPEVYPRELTSHSAWRALGGVALSQAAWREDVGYLALSAHERFDVLTESPAFSFGALA